MLAIVSDIHSNIEALNAVLLDIRAQEGISEILCLGDVIGYGPNPRECLRIAMKDFRFNLLGNHEQAVMEGANGFNPKARKAVEWTKDQLTGAEYDQDENLVFWKYLNSMPTKLTEGEVLYVHASPVDPTNQYVVPMDAYNEAFIDELMEVIPRIGFCGHTHIPGVFTQDYLFLSPVDIDNEYMQGERKLLVNVGSVGQPRDGDNRACYVLFDPEKRIIRYRRVAYDFETTIKKIEQSGLPETLGLRLARGV
ncbi:MAG: metallophosphoesterase family protein [Planctomycetes bacterium]|nr:metallophosphoesterase family protein [Planctomycetota bacterium]